MLEKYKDEEKLWKLTREELEKNKILTSKSIENILDVNKRKKLDKIYMFMQKNYIYVIKYKEDKYPEILRNIENFPIYIMVRGNLENLYYDNVAIVGTRNASEYGKHISRKLAYNLAEKNINIVSGLALRNR